MFRKRLIGFLLVFSMIMTEMAPTALAVTTTVTTENKKVVSELAPLENTIKETEKAENTVKPGDAFRSKLEKVNNNGLNFHSIVTDVDATDWFTWVYPEKDFTPDELLVPKNRGYQWHHKAVDSFTAWGATKGSKDITVAVIGGGVDPRVADIDDFAEFYLYENAVKETDEITTDLVGIIAADLNGKAGAGIAPDVTVHSYNVKDENGDIYTESFAQGVNKAVEDNVDIIFMQECSPWQTSEMKIAVAAAYEAGIPVIVPAGYIGTNTKMYPAAYEGVISVAGTNSNGYRINNSAYGDWVTVSAPGYEIYTSADSCYVGTEISAAIVTGTVALYMSVTEDEFNTSADVDALKELLAETGVKPASKDIPNIVNAANMLEDIIPAPQVEIEIDGVKVENLDDAIVIPADKESYLKFADVNESLNYVVAYTLDGKTPKITKGEPAKGTEIYDPANPVDLKELGEGKLTVTAVVYNKYGKNSVVMKQDITLTADGESGAISVTGPEGVVIGQKATFIADMKDVKDTWTWSVVDENDVKVPGAKVTNKGVLTLGKNTDVEYVKIVVTGKKTGLSGESALVRVYQPTVKVEAFIEGMVPDAKGIYTIDSSETEHLSISYKLFDKNGEISAELVEKVYGTVWKSSSAKIAEVDENGVVTIKNKGTAKITVTANDGSKKAATVSLKFSQKVREIVINSPLKISVNEGVSNHFMAKGTKLKFTADILPLGADNKTVKYYLEEEGNPDYAEELKILGITLTEAGQLSVDAKSTANNKRIVKVAAYAQDGSNVKAEALAIIVDTKATGVSVKLQEDYGLITKTDKQGNVSALTMYYSGEDTENSLNLDAKAISEIENTPVGFKSSNPDIVSVDDMGKITAGAKAGKATITVTAIDGSNKSAKVNVTVSNGIGDFMLTNGADAYGAESLVLAEGNKYAFKYIANDFTGKKFSGKLDWKVEWAEEGETLEITDYVTMKNGTLTAAKDLSTADGKKVKVTMMPVFRVKGADKTAETYVTLQSGIAKTISVTPATVNAAVKAGDETGIVKLEYKVLDANGNQLSWIPAIDWTVSNKKAAEIIEITDEYILVESLGTPGKVTVNAKATNGAKVTGKATVNFVNRITDFNLECKQVNILKGGKATIKVVDILTQTGAKPTINKFEWSVQDAKTGTPLTKEDGVTVSGGKVTIAKTFDMEIEGIAVVAKATDGSELEKIHVLNFVQPMDTLYVGVVKDEMGVLDSYQTDVTVKSDDEKAALEDTGILTINAKTGAITNINLFNTDMEMSEYDINGLKENRFDLEASGVTGDDKFIGGDFIWTSSNENIVSIEAYTNGSGYVDGRFVTLVGHTAGTAKITCEAADGSGKKVTLNVKVTVPVSDVKLTHTGETTPWWSSRDWAEGVAAEIIVANGKAVSFTAVAGDTFGKPTNAKLEWAVYDPMDWDEDGNFIEREESIKYTFKNGKLTVDKANAVEGWLIVEACAADGSGRMASCMVYVVKDMATFVEPVIGGELYKKDGETFVPVTEDDVMAEDFITSEKEVDGLTYRFITDAIPGAFKAESSDADIASVTDIAFAMYGTGEEEQCVRYVKHGENFYPVQMVVLNSGDKLGTAEITITATDGSGKAMSFDVVVKEPEPLERFIGKWYGNNYVGTVSGNDIYETMKIVVKDAQTMVIDGVEYTVKAVENKVYNDRDYENGDYEEIKDVMRVSDNGTKVVDFVTYKTSWDEYVAELHIWKYGYNKDNSGHNVIPLNEGEYFIPAEFLGDWFTRVKVEGVTKQIKVTLNDETGKYFIRENGAYNLQSEFEWKYFSGSEAEGIIITDGENIYEMKAVHDDATQTNYLRIVHNETNINFKRAEGYYGAAELGVKEEDLYGFWYNDITDGFYLEENTDGPNKMYTGFGVFNWEYNMGTINTWAVEKGETVSYGDIYIEMHIDSAGRDYISFIWEWTNNIYVPQNYFVPTELVDEWTGEVPGENGNEFESLILTKDNTAEIPEQMFVGAWIYRTDKDFDTDNRFVDLYGEEGELYRTYTVVDTDEGVALKYKGVTLSPEGTGGQTGVSSKLFEGNWTGMSPVDPLDENTTYNEIILSFSEEGTGVLIKGDDIHGVTGETFLWNYELNREENINRLILTDANGDKEGILNITKIEGRMTLVYEGVIDAEDSDGEFYEIQFAGDAAYAITEIFLQNSEIIEETPVETEELPEEAVEEQLDEEFTEIPAEESTEIEDVAVETEENLAVEEIEIIEEIHAKTEQDAVPQERTEETAK